jgi:hypothetical protein
MTGKFAGSFGRPVGQPPIEQGHPVSRPCPVAGHRPGPQPTGDSGPMSSDVLDRPQVKEPEHGLVIALAEERLDVDRKR